MANITKVEAFGLWSHYESTFEFSPGLTVITGPNDSGKSSLIRIIRWVFLGEPQGDAFLFKIKNESGEVQKETDEGKAVIYLDNGVKVAKIRRGKKTIYKHSGFSEPFETATVPEEVKDALGIKYYSFGDFEAALNFAFQLEPPFLISEADSAGAKVLGQLAGTEAVDLAIGKVRKDTYKARQDKLQAEKEVEKCNSKLLEYENLDRLKEQVEICENLIENIDQAAERADRLQELNKSLDKASYRIETLDKELDRLAIIPELEKDLKDIEAANNRYETLLDLYKRLDKNQTEIERLTKELKVYEHLPKADQIVNNLVFIHRKLDLLTDLSTDYDRVIRKIQEADRVLEKTKGVKKAAEILEKLETNKNRLERLKSLDYDYMNNDSLIKNLSLYLQRLSTVENAEKVINNLSKKWVKFKRLKEIKESWGYNTVTIADLESKLESFKKLEEAREIVNKLSTNWDKLMDLRSLRTRHRLVKEEADLVISYYEEAKDNVKAWEKELKKAWEETDGICPLCEEPIKKGVDHNHH